MNLPLKKPLEWLRSLKEDDDLFVAEYKSSTNNVEIKAYKIKTLYSGKSTIEGVESSAVLADIIDVKHPKVTIRNQDISHGFCASRLEAITDFVDIIDQIHEAAHKVLDKES